MRHGASGLVVMVGVVAAMAAGCGGGTPPPPPTAVAPAAPAASAPVVRPKEPETSKALPPIAYEPKGRRDPFTPIFVGKDNAGLSVSAVKLTGVVGGGGGLMALVELKVPTEKYEKAAIAYLADNAKQFEQVRMAAAGLEAQGFGP